MRAQNVKATGAALDVNYFINVMRVRGSIDMDGFKNRCLCHRLQSEYADLLDTDQADQKFVKDFISTRDNLRPALRALFQRERS